MGRSAVGTRPCEFKYGMALYGAAWPSTGQSNEYYFVCGGGGHGLVPRVVWARFAAGRCSDQVGEFRLGSQTPMRMAVCPWGSSLLLANADGGLRRLLLGRDAPGVPTVVEVTAAFGDALAEVAHLQEVGAMAFSPDGRLLALGMRGQGGVALVMFPGFAPCGHLPAASARADDAGVKDLAFGAAEAPSTADRQLLLAVVDDNGSCRLWRAREDGSAAVQITELAPPQGARFIRCRFAEPHSSRCPLQLHALLNVGRDASLLATYELALQGEGETSWRLARTTRLAGAPGSALEISADGRWIAAGFADGWLRVYDASRRLQLKAAAEASIAFVSSVAFRPDGGAVLAVGGDANCFVLELAGARASTRWWWLFVMLLLACALSAWHAG